MATLVPDEILKKDSMLCKSSSNLSVVLMSCDILGKQIDVNRIFVIIIKYIY